MDLASGNASRPCTPGSPGRRFGSRVPSAPWLAMPLLCLAAAAADAQSAACSQLKATLAARIDPSIRGFSLDIVPASAAAPAGAKGIGTCDGGAYKILYRKGGASRPAADEAGASAVADAVTVAARVKEEPARPPAAPSPAGDRAASAAMPAAMPATGVSLPVPAPRPAAASATPPAAVASAGTPAMAKARAGVPPPAVASAPPPRPMAETPGKPQKPDHAAGPPQRQDKDGVALAAVHASATGSGSSPAPMPSPAAAAGDAEPQFDLRQAPSGTGRPWLQQISEALAGRWAWLVGALAVPILFLLWAWYAHHRAYDSAGLPRGPRL